MKPQTRGPRNRGPIEDPHGVLARHGRTFHWAGLFLDRQQRRDAAVLYSFCRHADDLADESDRPADELAALGRRLVRSGSSSPTDPAAPDPDPRTAAFVELADRLDFDPSTLDHFLAGLRTDAGVVRFRERGELIRYAYGVASTVGLWMCSVLGVRQPAARPFAIDLGIAMQLTNVCRDVLEDAARGRIYLPLPGHVTAAGLVHDAPGHRQAARDEVLQTLDVAQRYYRSADRGLRYLPLRPRLAILCARRIYEAIGAELVCDGVPRIESRAVVPTSRKLWLTLQAGVEMLRRPMLCGSSTPEGHDDGLHAALRVHPAATEPAR